MSNKKFLELQNDEYYKDLKMEAYSRAIWRDMLSSDYRPPKINENLDFKLLAVVQMYLNHAFKISDRLYKGSFNYKGEYNYSLTRKHSLVAERGSEYLQRDFLRPRMNTSFKSAAEILKNIYYYDESQMEKQYYLLISSMSYYISNDFSKSYALLNNVNHKNLITKLIGLLLRKDFNNLFIESLKIDEKFKDFQSKDYDTDTTIYLLILSKTMINYLSYMITGNHDYFKKSLETVTDLVELTEIDNDVLSWHLFKLLRLVLINFHQVSLWKVIPSLVDEYNETFQDYIISNLLNKPSIVELFPLQISALKKTKNNSGAVISIPTSSGKTKIAEINIINTINNFPKSIALYVAPFKSLAYEVEASLSKSLESLNIKVSNMYGDRTESLFDTFLADDAQVLIVTPEKAKMMLRNNKDIKEHLKLVILDEGHLIGGDNRFTRNELFYEELNYFVNKVNGKFITLSAVLPNPDNIAKWLNGSNDKSFSSTETTNQKRFGILYWEKDNSVRLDWGNQAIPPMNNFLNEISGEKNKIVPNNKREAVCLTAIKLSTSGKVFIYLARKNMIKKYVEYLSTVLNHQDNHTWNNQIDWNIYKSYLNSYYGENSLFLKIAEKGVIIHHGSLPNDLRIITEKLLRKSNPKIIIATSTLAQGVNIGVSTIIIGHYFASNNPITKSQFNNIIGRAGRSYVDIDAKILFAIDAKTKDENNIYYHRKNFNNYINNPIEKVESGIYYLLKKIYQLSLNSGMSFESLLEIISNQNTYEETHNIINDISLLDDTLLSLLNEEEFIVENLDDIIRSSFAYLMSTNESNDFNQEKIYSMVVSRAYFIKEKYQESDSKDLYIQSGVEISFVKFLEGYERKMEVLLENILEEQGYSEALLKLFVEISNSELNIYRDDGKSTNYKVLKSWISGEKWANSAYSNFTWEKFDYELPLIIQTFSKIFSLKGKENYSQKLIEINELVKFGLPSISAVKLYLIGINSREAATILSNVYSDVILGTNNQSELSKLILDRYTEIEREFIDYSFYPVVYSWFRKNMSTSSKLDRIIIDGVDIKDNINELRVIDRKNHIYLSSLDLEYNLQVNRKDLPPIHKEIINNYYYFFKKVEKNKFVLQGPNL